MPTHPTPETVAAALARLADDLATVPGLPAPSPSTADASAVRALAAASGLTPLEAGVRVAARLGLELGRMEAEHERTRVVYLGDVYVPAGVVAQFRADVLPHLARGVRPVDAPAACMEWLRCAARCATARGEPLDGRRRWRTVAPLGRVTLTVDHTSTRDGLPVLIGVAAHGGAATRPRHSGR